MKGNPTLTPLRKLGYESGIGAESIVYNMFYVYFMIFLTTIVGVKPALAGTISLIAAQQAAMCAVIASTSATAASASSH